ncbi:hypothetical protein GF352_05100 [archaeon]|nr:hypothetical protein [archaeon]
MSNPKLKTWYEDIKSKSAPDIYKIFTKQVKAPRYYGSILMYTYLNLCGAGHFDASTTDEEITKKIDNGASIDEIKELLKEDDFKTYDETDLDLIFKAHKKWEKFLENKIFVDVTEGKGGKIIESLNNRIKESLSDEDDLTKRIISQFSTNIAKNIEDSIGKEGADNFKKANYESIPYDEETKKDFYKLLEFTINEVYGNIDDVCDTYIKQSNRKMRYFVNFSEKTGITPEDALSIVNSFKQQQINALMTEASKEDDDEKLAEQGRKLIYFKNKSLTKIILYTLLQEAIDFTTEEELKINNLSQRLISEKKKSLKKKLSSVKFNDDYQTNAQKILSLKLGFKEKELINKHYVIETSGVTISGSKGKVIKNLNKIHGKSYSKINEFMNDDLIKITEEETSPTELLEKLMNSEFAKEEDLVGRILSDLKQKEIGFLPSKEAIQDEINWLENNYTKEELEKAIKIPLKNNPIRTSIIENLVRTQP